MCRVHLNGQLVVDLGGVHAAQNQFVELNRLGLTDGQIYPLDFFYAERHRTQSNCRIQTNLLLNSNAVPSVTAGVRLSGRSLERYALNQSAWENPRPIFQIGSRFSYSTRDEPSKS